jgi:hypothetical protein
MDEIKKLIREVLLEKKKKRDRCLRIADRKYDKPSAYKSGAVVRCRKGEIWKGIKEDIDPKEVFSNVGALQTIIDNKRNIGFFSLDEINSPKTFWDIVKENDLGFVKVEKNPNNAYIIYKKGYENQANELKDLANKYNGYLSYKATEEDTRRIGELLGYKKEAIDSFIEKLKTLDEAKKETLRTWFKRKGTPGKTGGWVDCNAPIRKDGKITGYKACGRKKGENRAKYPACRPTPAGCKAKGKGKTWGKTK